MKTWSSRTGIESSIEIVDWLLGSNQFAKDGMAMAGRLVERSSSFCLGSLQPNPVNDFTSLDFGIGTDCFLRLSVFNSLGLKVGEPICGYYVAGSYRVEFEASTLPPGLYIGKMEGEGFSASQPMIISR